MKTEEFDQELGREISRAEFLGLTPEDEAIVDIRLALHQKLKESRAKSGLSQTAVARRIHSSQARIAKAEAGNPSVSFEFLIRATIASGATPAEIGNAISSAPRKAAGKAKELANK